MTINKIGMMVINCSWIIVTSQPSLNSAVKCIWLHIMQYSTVQYSTVQYSTVQYSTVQYSTLLHCTVLYCTALHCTALYCTPHHYYTVRYSSTYLVNLSTSVFKHCCRCSSPRHTIVCCPLSSTPTSTTGSN